MRQRLFLAFTLVIITTLGTLAFLTRPRFVEAVNAFAQRGGFIGADKLVFSLEEFYIENAGWENVDRIFEEYPLGDGFGFGNPQGGRGSQQRGMRGFYLTDINGEIIYTPDGTEPNELLKGDELELGIPLHHEDKTIGYLIPLSHFPFPKNIIQTNLTPLLNETLLPTLFISGILALALATLIGFYFLRPVHHLTEAANIMAQGDFSHRVQVRGKDELAILATTFNQMAASLEHAEESRRAMTTDIAHELRTPLAVQRANLEALQDGIYPLTMENLDPIMEQNRLLTKLVEDLRTLAQTDYDDLTLEIHEYNLIPFLDQIIANFQPQAAQQNVKLNFFHHGPCSKINMDARRINQVINNLMQNAFQHTPEKGSVTLTLECLTDSVEISLRDTGSGITPETLPHIFERFYRGEQPRVGDKGGSGIGLTIARRLVEAHGGTLSAENHPEGGAIFTISLPVVNI